MLFTVFYVFWKVELSLLKKSCAGKAMKRSGTLVRNKNQSAKYKEEYVAIKCFKSNQKNENLLRRTQKNEKKCTYETSMHVHLFNGRLESTIFYSMNYHLTKFSGFPLLTHYVKKGTRKFIIIMKLVGL